MPFIRKKSSLATLDQIFSLHSFFLVQSIEKTCATAGEKKVSVDVVVVVVVAFVKFKSIYGLFVYTVTFSLHEFQ